MSHQVGLRAAISAAHHRSEQECVLTLLAQARLSPEQNTAATSLALSLVTALRRQRGPNIVEALLQEFSLSSSEGVALMCLAEALLRIPDDATRDALIRDKIGRGEWRSHIGNGRPLFLNAAAWGLLLTGRLAAAHDETGLSAALTRLVARAGEPVIRRGMDAAMRMMGEEFVMGQTIDEALNRACDLEAQGFRHSYDMLGEAALTAGDAARYFQAYQQAIEAIGRASDGSGPVNGPGISIKLSALHPRYARSQRGRVMAELLPRLLALATMARRHDIGLNIDAEEADRLDLSLDLMEALCKASALEGWNGIGFVVQAYGKRAPFVLDWLIDLARRTNHRIMVRLVKGAYWDSEIKRAQVNGLEDFPVFTRKIHTDVSYLACARRLLDAQDAVFPQFATHNARTLSAVLAMAGPEFHPGRYEFQCLHGMGEPLYREVLALDRPCRIYAPVGTHDTLLAYLVRRLLENGANSSFVNQVGDPRVPVEELVRDPVEAAAAIVPLGAPHPRICRPPELFGVERKNSVGLDLSDEAVLARLADRLSASATRRLLAMPMLAARDAGGQRRPVLNPADHRDTVGEVAEATPEVVDEALAAARAAAPGWAATTPVARAAILERAADLFEAGIADLLGPIVREAGKCLGNAIGEVREAVDFLRYYAAAVRGWEATHGPLGVVACISPWNFPLAIFTGQVAAALAAGNVVLAKPAEETPLIASLAVGILRQAGVPVGALQLLPGDGAVGARLVADPVVQGVLFTGSTEVAQSINRTLARRLTAHGGPVPLIAETGGQNVLVVDSSALPEQVVTDVIASAFDSAGQRCSALRVLCLQEEVADRITDMLRGAMQELSIGNPDRLSTDVGPVISEEAQSRIVAHIEAMCGKAHRVTSAALPAGCVHGTFVPPTIIEIDRMANLGREVFGPVLHILRYRREGLGTLLQDIAGSGYGLTFGVHSRLDSTVDRLVAEAPAGNVYVNRNLIGAAVGVQPFGGHGLSGTGPKAGGPLYLRRLLSTVPGETSLPAGTPPTQAKAYLDWLRDRHPATVPAVSRQLAASRVGMHILLPGPVGEENRYALWPRGTVLCQAITPKALLLQLAACFATGNEALVVASPATDATLSDLPPPLFEVIRVVGDGIPTEARAVLVEADGTPLPELLMKAAAGDGPIRPVLVLSSQAIAAGDIYPLDMLLAERSVSINTAAAGGNASLLSL